MKTNYELVKIGKLLKDEYILDLQDGNHGEMHPKSTDYVESGIPFVMANNVNNHTVDLDGAFKISKDNADKLRIGFAKNGDVLLTHKGTIGNTAIVENADPYIMLTPQVTYYRVNDAKLNNYYLLYCFDDPFFQKTIISLAQQSTRPYIGITAQKRLLIRLRKIDSQLKIVSILKLFDDLLNANRRRIQLLEEVARLLFREWFVHFRFPGHEKVKIVDGLPLGWKKLKLTNIINTIESGGRPKGGAIDEGIPSIGAENVNGIGKHNYSNEKYVPEEYYQKMRKGKVISKDVLLYKDGANIGRTTIVGYGFPHNKCCVNEHVFILRTKNNIQNWLYFFLLQDFIKQAIVNLNSNSAQPGISQDKLLNLKIFFPDEKIVKMFNDEAEDIVRNILTLSIQNQKLAQARDLLLPRLMSGEIEV